MTTLNSLLMILNHSSNWNDIYNQLLKYNTPQKYSAGKLFEEFCKYYFLAEPTVKNDYKHVWFFSEIPLRIKEKLNLGKIDHGIDLVLEGYDGNFSVVQCKFRNNQNSNISWTKDNLANLFAEGDKADYLIVFTNASGLDKHSLSKKENQLKLVTFSDLLSLSSSTINEIKAQVLGLTKTSVNTKQPREYQRKAIQEVINGFNQNDRGQLILPCGAGKTLVSLWIKDALDVKHTLVLVPSLALLRQIKNEWAMNSKRVIPYICVCSEKDIDIGKDRSVVHTYEISGKVSTNADEIRNFLNSNQETIVYSTYQSLEAICDAVKESEFEFDLAICDEAHKTSGSKLSKFGLIHSNSNISVKKRLYMTATPRVLSDNLREELTNELIDYIHDMGNRKIFGSEFYRMSFKEAIEEKILVDYKIVAIGVSNKELELAILQRKYISDNETIDEIANNYALEKLMKKYNPTHAITFHSSVKKAKSFQERHRRIYQEVATYHVNGELTTNERNIRMKEFERAPKSVMTNARCLTEGVDVPAIDVVYFCDPKNSKIDIVQATGRALRRADHKEKKFGYVVVPIFHQEKDSVEKIIDAGPFKNLMSVIRALSAHDERLVDEIKEIKIGKGESQPTTKHISINYSCDLITMDGFHEKLNQNLFDQIINKTRIPWRKFEDAREYTRSLNFKSTEEWRKNASKQLPADIPTNPNVVYEDDGWISFTDWIGKESIIKDFLPYDAAIKFVHKLALKNAKEWQDYSKTDRPDNIPSAPDVHYKEWISWPHWLGTKTRSSRVQYISFQEARSFVHTLNLKTKKEWTLYRKSNEMPKNIPPFPDRTYKGIGWISTDDWLGVIPKASFQEARKFVHALSLKSESEWRVYKNSNEIPEHIPKNPPGFYKNKGWVSWPHWLGTNIRARQEKYLPFEEARKWARNLKLKIMTEWREYKNKPFNIPSKPWIQYPNNWISINDWLGSDFVSTRHVKYLSFEEARKFTHSLNLRNRNQWDLFCHKKGRPKNIPYAPDKHYKEWISWPDWLGINFIAAQKIEYLPFEDARKFVHSLKLKNGAQWKIYCQSGNKPQNIPFAPRSTYKDKGWLSMGDWLGTGYISSQKRKILFFNDARKFVHTLKLSSTKDWKKYCNSGNKPSNIPSYPRRTYKNKGWISMGDWLGTERVAHHLNNYRSFDEARIFARTLKLPNEKSWRIYCKNANKPCDIPASPNYFYKNEGWISWPDWLGTEYVPYKSRGFLSFEEARHFVHTLKLKSTEDWKRYCNSGNKPSNIPSYPRGTYKNKGWMSIGDWLGSGKVATQERIYRSFEVARIFVHSLKLFSANAWREYCKSGNKPADIPASPNSIYKKEGWVSWPDWLGT